jgi:hypothetical protein
MRENLLADRSCTFRNLNGYMYISCTTFQTLALEVLSSFAMDLVLMLGLTSVGCNKASYNCTVRTLRGLPVPCRGEGTLFHEDGFQVFEK